MNGSKLFFLTSVLMVCGTVSWAEYPSGYYDSLEGKNKGELKTAAHNIIRRHTNIGYGDNTWNAFKQTDVKVVNGTRYWWDMYSPELVPVSGGHGGLNIEHSVANSWWDGTKNDAYNDIHHLNPSNSTANNRKSNYPLGRVATVSWTNGVTTVGKPSSAAAYGGATNVYEPCDEYKGDFARVFMYMFTCYEDMVWGSRFTWMYTQGQEYPMFRPWAVDLLLEWNRQDPVSNKEINRNDAVYSIQKNRNPFIDLPELAEYIWGNRKDEPFSLDGGQGTVPELTTPKHGASYNLGSRQTGATATTEIPLKGRGLTAPLDISIAGDSQFSLSKTSVTASEAMSGTTFTVSYTASTVGSVSATVTVSGGGLEAPVQLTVMATGVEKTALTPVTALKPDPLKADSYRALWSEAPVTPDYYIVSRTYMVNGQAKTRKYMTADPYYDFTDRDLDNDESYSVQYAVGSDVSGPSNVIEVKAGTLASPSVNDDDFQVSCVKGGIDIICGAANLLTVTDVSGRNVVRLEHATPGSFIPLQKGIYILSSPKLRKPLKIYVP